ncbi:MAG: hypothetical protein ACK4NW_02010 [Roseinatronobacter sp.]
MYQISNPRWVGENAIDVTWQHPTLGQIEYTAIGNSGEVEMQAIWDGLMRGDYGQIANAGN